MKKSPFQFSLSALLLTVAFVAGVLALMFWVPTEIARIILIVAVVVLSGLGLTGLASGGTIRTFCIGSLVPLAMMLFFISSDLAALTAILTTAEPSYLHAKGFEAVMVPPLIGNERIPRLLGAGILMSIVLGYLCVGFRWLIERRESSDV